MTALPAAGWLGCERIELVSCPSTNDRAAVLAKGGAPHGTIVIAHTQTAGRGRQGRTWHSPPGTGLYLSAIVRPPALALEQVAAMTLAIGIGVCDAARAITGDSMPKLKWPNDVLVGKRKLAGVLVESQSQGSRLETLIIGIGINLIGPVPAELAATAASLDELAPDFGAADRERFLEVLLAHVERWIDRYVADGVSAVIDAWQLRMAPELEVRVGDVSGRAIGLAADGALIVCDGTGRAHHVRAGHLEIA